MKHIYRRKSIRIKKYDYSQIGVYFVTMCAQGHRHLFGEIVNCDVILNDIGNIARKCWFEIPDHFPDIEIDEFIIMPNHMHGIIIIKSVGVAYMRPLQNRTKMLLPMVIQQYKSAVSRLCRQNGYKNFQWQRNYYEHVIRNDESLNKIREYVIYNPLEWNTDLENLDYAGKLSTAERTKQIKRHNDNLYI